MSNAITTLSNKLATTFGMDAGGAELLATLKATAFKGPATDAQLTALLIVAQQYGLNPFTKEIFAFPDNNKGIVPVVGVDGWSRIINDHPQFDGIEFEQDDQSCTAIIHRKDRSHPTRVTEYFSECKRGTQPWQSHPKRMMRHKALIQCSRLAFGFTGIFDEDEAHRIVEKDMGSIDAATGEIIAKASVVAMPQSKSKPAKAAVLDANFTEPPAPAVKARGIDATIAASSEAATPGEKAYVTKTIERMGFDLAGTLAECNVASLDALTKAEFLVVRDHLRTVTV